MRHDKLQKELDLLILMTENKNYTVKEMCDRLGISKRNLYYYLDFFRNSGFNVIKSGLFYRLDRHSPFFKKLHESIDFTEQEAIFLRRLLSSTDDADPLADNIRHKLDSFYDLRILTDTHFRSQVSANISKLYEAIKLKQPVVLKRYSSPHSHTVSDRIVEPFCFMNDNMDVRCYEIVSSMNKTFKVTRMESVEIINALWSHEAQHKQLFTDIFMFSGEQKHRITLLLGQLSYNLFVEEYPQAATCVTAQDSMQWLLEIDVCNYIGITRFVLGLLDDIQVLGDEGFKQYLSNRIAGMKMR